MAWHIELSLPLLDARAAPEGNTPSGRRDTAQEGNTLSGRRDKTNSHNATCTDIGISSSVGCISLGFSCFSQLGEARVRSNKLVSRPAKCHSSPRGSRSCHGHEYIQCKYHHNKVQHASVKFLDNHTVSDPGTKGDYPC